MEAIDIIIKMFQDISVFGLFDDILMLEIVVTHL